MQIIIIENAEKEIARTNFYDTQVSERGCYYCSINAGAFRLLAPPSKASAIKEMMTGKVCVVTYGMHRHYFRPMFEFLFDDDSDTPFALFLDDTQSVDRILPSYEKKRSDLVISVWTKGIDDSPNKAFQMPAFYRTGNLPCLKPWKGVTHAN